MAEQIQTNSFSIFESVLDYAIIITDSERNIIAWNKGAERIFEYTSEEIIGNKIDILFTPQDRKNNAQIQEIETAKKEGRAADERWHLKKDGTRFYVSGVLTMVDKNQFIKIARDLTERKLSEEAINQTDKRKNEFLATLSHELRNPLASIYSGLEILKEERDEQKRTEVELTIERQLLQIVHLVDDLLDISRITQGKIKLQKAPIDIQDAIHHALEMARPIIEGSQHKINIELPVQALIVNGDFTRLSQVILNILINAAKYTKPGGTIAIREEIQNNKVLVRIRDNGLGIPKHMLTKIFEMFTQIDSSERPQSGLGIGLSVVKQLVEMHEGKVEAFSDGENSGSEFVVTLPLVRNENISAMPKNKPSEKYFATNTLQKKRVLIIDDNEDAADMMFRLLKKRGYVVDITYTGRTGVQKVLEFKPEVILLDIGLPDISGYEVATEIRKAKVPCYIIGLSGWGQEEDRKLSENAGFDHHLVKPVDFSTILTLLNSFP